MANISLKICGNQHSNSGFQPLVLFNSPESLIIEDKGYGGFSENAYYFSIKIKENHVHYKLIMNNVSSYQAKREGALVIAIAIPKGFKLANEKSPYDVLIKLKDEFVSKCMILKNGKFEFLDGRIEPNLMDDTARSFELEIYNGPYYPMNGIGSTACVKLEDAQIRQLLIDVQYSVFANYGEILVANKVNSTDYHLLAGLQIPRISEYAIYVDGILKSRESNLTKTLIYSGNKDSNYYDNRELKFSIEELKAGKSFDGVTFDEYKEDIHISLANYSTPRKHTLYLKFTPENLQDKVMALRNNFVLQYENKRCSLNKDLSFSLQGEEIASSHKLSFYINNQSKFSIKNTFLAGDFFNVTIEEIVPNVVQPITITQELKMPNRESDCLEINLQLKDDDYALDFNKSREIQVKIYEKNEMDIPLQSTRLWFSSIQKQIWSSTLVIPKTWHNVVLQFACGDYIYTSKKTISNYKSGAIDLKNQDFYRERKPLKDKFKRYIIYIALIITLLIGIVIGGLGHKFYPMLKKVSTSYTCECGEKFDTQEELNQHQTEKKYICDISGCDARFHTQKELTEHKQKKLYSCSVDGCDESFHTKAELDQHTSEKKFACNKKGCNEQFHTQKELNLHKNSKTHFCSYCDERFHTQKELNMHITEDHHFTCEICGPDKWFYTETELTNHKKKHHAPRQGER